MSDYKLADVPAAIYDADPSAYWQPRCPVSLARRDSDVDRETVDGVEVCVIAYRGAKSGTALAPARMRTRDEVATRRAAVETQRRVARETLGGGR